MFRLGCAAPLAFVAVLTASERAAAECKLDKLFELPVAMQGTRPIVAAQINGLEASLLADSGAFFSTMSRANAQKYGLRLGAAPFGAELQGVTGAAAVALGRARTFAFAGLPLRNVDFLVGGGEIGGGAAGLVGQNLFRAGDAEYDLANGAIRVWRPRGCGRANLAYWGKPGQNYSVVDIEPTTPARPHTRGDVFINGVRLHAMFDTGAASSMITRRGAAKFGVTPETPGVLPAGYTSGVGRRTIKTWIAPVASFKIGDEETRGTRLRFGDLELGETDMLVGADFFLSHRVYVATSQSKLYLTYNGGAVFDLASRTAATPPAPSAAGAPTIAEPLDASGFSRRGLAHLARRELEAAIADLSRAVALAPTAPDYLVQRAQVRLAARQPRLARADLDAAIDLKPDDARARVYRAELEMREPDKSHFVADLDAAARLAAAQDDVRLTLANGYLAAERPAAAIAQFDLWIAAHGDDYRLPFARNGRCRARALADQDLAKALADCDAAMHGGNAAVALDSRGLVYLRLGRYDRAIADYDAALQLNPKIAWSLYGRGVAELRIGQDARAAADLAAASALAPALPRLATTYGIAPDAK